MDELEKQINDEFCQEVGIKQACCFILNKDTSEIKFYSSPSGLYKKPKGWKHIQTGKFEPRYPDLIYDSFNFMFVLNVHWYLFGNLGDSYNKTGDETFEVNYLKTRLNAMKMCKSFGGGDLLDEYKKQVRELPFNYLEV